VICLSRASTRGSPNLASAPLDSAVVRIYDWPVADDLESQNQRLLAENAELRAALGKAEARIAELVAEVSRLAELVASLNDRISELLAIAQRRKSPTPKPERQPEPPPSLDAQARTKFEDRPLPPELPPRPEKQNKARRPTGRKAVPG